MGKQEIFKILCDYKKEFAEKYGIIALGLFGSVVREEADKNSDVDIVVRVKNQDFLLIDEIRHELEDRIHMPVDIVSYRDNMNQFFKQKLESEVIYA